MKRTALVGHLDASHQNQTVTLQGWVNRRRDLGGLIFIELRDRSGIVQVQVEPDSPAFSEAYKLRAEYVSEVEVPFPMRPDAQPSGRLRAYDRIPIRRSGPHSPHNAAITRKC